MGHTLGYLLQTSRLVNGEAQEESPGGHAIPNSPGPSRYTTYPRRRVGI